MFRSSGFLYSSKQTSSLGQDSSQGIPPASCSQTGASSCAGGSYRSGFEATAKASKVFAQEIPVKVALAHEAATPDGRQVPLQPASLTNFLASSGVGAGVL